MLRSSLGADTQRYTRAMYLILESNQLRSSLGSDAHRLIGPTIGLLFVSLFRSSQRTGTQRFPSGDSEGPRLVLGPIAAS